MKRKMTRSCDEWYNYAVTNGTSGDMVFDILADWQTEYDTLREAHKISSSAAKAAGVSLKELTAILNELNNIYYQYKR